jgi:glycosyltransferase involved in cell wall biosynthesis
VRILIGHNYYRQSGGEDAVFANEKSLLQRHGHEVIECCDNNLRLDTIGRLAAAHQTIWSRPSYQAIKDLIRDSRPEIAHFHNTFLLLSPSVYDACQEMGVPVVQTLHNYRLLCPVALFYRKGKICETCLRKSFAWPGIYHACYRNSRVQSAVVATMLTLHRIRKTWRERVDMYIALTEFSRRKFIAGGLPAEKTIVKPNFINLDPGEKKTAGEFGLFVGRLAPEKGILTLLRAWHEIDNIPLHIVGTGELESKVHRMTEGLRKDTVKIHGQLTMNQVFTIMKKARFLIFPSECFENFALVIVEAFACGLPVIASRLGTMAEIIDDGRTGILFTPGDHQDLAVKVQQVWNHPQETRKIGRQARLEFEKKYTPEGNYKAVMDIYTTLLHRRSAD